MRMLIWKELRENFKWAILAMLVLGMAEIHSLYQTRYGYQDYYYNDGITICKNSFLTVTTFGCAAVGFLLGLIQIIPELKRDRWAALLHRPVRRGVIFRGKVAAGILLYLIATVPPFLLAIWLVATPGNFGVPFVPKMVLPGTADICTGLVFYFAGLAVALQRGGWIGLRVIPLLAAVFTSFSVQYGGPFYLALENTVMMGLFLFATGWGAIHNQDLFRERPLLGRLAFMAVTFYGACGLGLLIQSFVKVVEPPTHSTFVQYQLTDEGFPIRLTSVDDVVVLVEGLDGNKLTGPEYKPDRVRNHLRYLNGLTQNIGDAHGWHPFIFQNSYRDSRTYLWANGPYMYPRMEQWFYLEEAKYLVGVLPNQKKAFAILDQNGFEPITAKPEGFLAQTEMGYAGQDAYCLWEPTRARFAFLPTRQITNVVLPAPGPIYGQCYAWASNGNSSVYATGLALPSGVAVYDEKTIFTTLLPYTRDVSRWGGVSLGMSWNKDRYYLWYSPSSWIDDKTRQTMPSYVDEVTPAGQILHSYTLPPIPDIKNPTAWHDFVWWRLQSPAFFFGTMLYKKVGAAFGSIRMHDDLSWQWSPQHARTQTRSVSASIAGLSLVLAVIALFWARSVRIPWAQAWFWAVFVLAFDLSGFVTFWLLADWPRFVDCARCGKKRPIEENLCPHCGSPWPTPEATGIEILERSDEKLVGTSV